VILICGDGDMYNGLINRCKRARNTFETLEEYYDFLEQIEDIIYNFRENVDLEITRNKLEALARQCEEHARLDERKRMLRIDEADEEFDWNKMKLPNLVNKDKMDQIRSMFDLKNFGPIDNKGIKLKVQRASGFSNELCHERGIQELKSCFSNFL